MEEPEAALEVGTEPEFSWAVELATADSPTEYTVVPMATVVVVAWAVLDRSGQSVTEEGHS